MKVNSLVSFFIVLLIGSTIKRTIKEEHPVLYKRAMEDAPWYIRIGEKL